MFPRHLLFLQIETLPCRLEILRWNSLSLRCVPVSEWVLGIRSLFLIILLNHLPQEIQFLRLCGLSGLLLHSVFWYILLMHPTFPILQDQQSECLLSKSHPRSKHIPELMDSWLVFRRNRVRLNQWTKRNDRSFKWLPNTSFIGRLPIG